MDPRDTYKKQHRHRELEREPDTEKNADTYTERHKETEKKPIHRDTNCMHYNNIYL